MGRNHFTDESFDVLEAVQAIANEKDCTPGQVALAWCKDKPGITSPIIGPRTMEQLEDNLGAVEVSLDENDHERLDAVAPPGRSTVPYYEADFGPHPPAGDSGSGNGRPFPDPRWSACQLFVC